MKSVFHILAKLLVRACTACVTLSFVFFACMKIFNLSDGISELAIPFSQYLLFFVFALCLSGAAYIFRIPLSRPLVIFIHYAACAAVFFVTFLIAGKLSFENASRVFLWIVLFTVFYAIALGVYLLIRFLLYRKKRTEKKEKEQALYEKRF
jgi:hypothetical protein